MSNALTTLILDDEPLAAARLCRMLRRIGGIGEVMVGENGLDGLELFARTRPDLILLDIEMPRLNGFQFLEALPQDSAPVIVFVTAFDRYAVKAYEKRALNYLMKPVAFDRLAAAVEDARRSLSARDAERRIASLRTRISDLSRQLGGRSSFLQDLWVPHRDGLSRIAVCEIDRIEAEKDYVRIHAGGRSCLLHRSLGALEKALDPTEFRRVHRSAIVRIGAIEAVRHERFGALSLLTQGGGQVRVSRKYAPDIRRMLSRADHAG